MLKQNGFYSMQVPQIFVIWSLGTIFTKQKINMVDKQILVLNKMENKLHYVWMAN